MDNIFKDNSNISIIFQETETLLGEKLAYTSKIEFDEIFEDVRNILEDEQQQRLGIWLAFFNENWSRCTCAYSAIIHALLELRANDELFQSQTEHERATSFYFFTSIFKSGLFLFTDNIEIAKILIKISLIYGKYPGMQIRPMQKAIRLLKDGLNEFSLFAFFECLFIKYESPKILIHNLVSLNAKEVEILMFVLQGKNIKTYTDQMLSKKEAYFFINELPLIKFENEVIKRSIAISKLVAINNNSEIIHNINRFSKVFNAQINLFLEDIDFWKSAYRILLKIVSELIYEDDFFDLSEYIDYFEYMRYQSGIENFSLKGRTPNSLSRAIQDWHFDVGIERQTEIKKLSWKRNNENDAIETEMKNTILHNNRRYSFQELTSGEELLLESKTLKHCVFSYSEICYFGYSSIWSMQIEKDDKFEKYYTIEIQKNQIVQIKGKQNKIADKNVLEIIRKWAERNKIKFQDTV